MTYTCAVQVESSIVELCVASESPFSWRWSFRLLNGPKLREGISDSKVAAQIAAQLAFKERLQKAGLKRWASDAYYWRRRTNG